MVKLSYYNAVGQDNTDHLLYGASKKQIHLIGEEEGLGPFKQVQELALTKIKDFHDEQTFVGVREMYRNFVGKDKVAKVEETETVEENE
jgi:hypothetical protein